MISQIILEQIDIMVVGPKKFQFVALVLQKSFEFQQQISSSESSPNSSAGGYIKMLKRFLTLSTSQPSTNTSNTQSIKSTTQLPTSSKQIALVGQTQQFCESLIEEAQSVPLKLTSHCGLHKFTKMIETQTFWLTLNFYLTDLKIYDPILSEYTRGNIQIGIIVGDDQTSELDQIKQYLSSSNQSALVIQNLKQSQKNSRSQNSIEAKINSRIQSPCVNGFSSLLCLRLRDGSRLIQETNNLRLSNNQIFRWIVDRYFQNRYKIKLKETLGDQIQRGPIKNPQESLSTCQIM